MCFEEKHLQEWDAKSPEIVQVVGVCMRMNESFFLQIKKEGHKVTQADRSPSKLFSLG